MTIIIEDEPFVRHDLRFMLSAFPDIEIAGEAETTQEAARLLDRLEPDLVFLDIHLRGGSGLDLLPLIDKSASVVILTAHEDLLQNELAEIAACQISKPVTHSRLAVAIQTILSSKRTLSKG